MFTKIGLAKYATTASLANRTSFFEGPVSSPEVQKFLRRDVCAVFLCEHAAARILRIHAILRKLQGLEYRSKLVSNFRAASPPFSLT